MFVPNDDRAICDDVDMYLNVPSPLTDDTTITLTVASIECEIMNPDTNPTQVTEIVVEGGTLTINSDDTVQFINLAFVVMPGAALVFDMPETLFGPNDWIWDGDYPEDSLIVVGEDADLTFNGDVTFYDVAHAAIVLENYGTTEFKKTTLVEENSGGFWVVGGSVKFSGTATFNNNGRTLDGSYAGCDVLNTGSTSKISFRGDATFSGTKCQSAEATSLYNNGVMTFYGKARFDDNTSGTNGGAVLNQLGTLTFRRAVQFNGNDAEYEGGGIAVDGGDVTFRKGVTFDGNNADSGGAFAVLFGEFWKSGTVTDSGFGTLTFEKPSKVRFSDNSAVDIESTDDDNCTVGEVEEGGTLIGYPDDDVCVAAF
eukprot:jgi/Undpi1/5155/HiC_scaffold_19.g08506.m1